MSAEFVAVIAIVSSVIWILVSRELAGSPKEQMGRKVFSLMFAGVISTVILTVALVQSLI
ncbi:hypothetical protein D3H55_02070 [Bacillus salacetis]|uniref:Uncharacterized protein n=1 Tax=Bacillus salacetis TaxID=2315464 RepID=A0A3A1RAD3_9BACI|nr:hypothetical protein [Bacillus salacetis]RIW38351.1 hypothetical protein D3H55_02070 [Bacillus salacetis]